MNSATEQSALQTNTMEIEAMAAQWIAARCDAANWNDAEQTRLELWLAESAAHEVAYLRLLALWNSADRIAVLRRPMRQTPDDQTGRRIGVFLRVAAAAFVIMAAGSISLFLHSHAE